MARRRLPHALAAAGCALAAACGSTQIDLSGKDSETFFGGLRGSWSLDGRTEEATEPPTTELLLEAEVAYSSSDFDQTVPSGFVIDLDPVSFSGPTDVRADFDLALVTADGRLRLRSQSGLGLDLFLGLGWSGLDLDVTDGVASFSDSVDGLGPRAGAAVFYELPPRLRFFVEAAYQASVVQGGDDLAEIETYDFGLELRLTRALSLLATWRQLEYVLENTPGSDYELVAAGPRLTLAASW